MVGRAIIVPIVKIVAIVAKVIVIVYDNTTAMGLVIVAKVSTIAIVIAIQ